MVYVCEECKEEFSDIKHKGRRFCSRKCFDEFRKKMFREEVRCEQCGVKMIRNKCFKRRFCCRDCYAESLKGSVPWNKGRKETRKEVLKKLSDSHIGLQMGENNGNYGKEPWNKGLTYSRPEMSGELHPNWMGGISFTKYTLDWTRTLRRSIRERDRYTCRLCGKQQTERAFDVHHIDYNKKNCNPDNLVTLCRSCHMKTNTKSRVKWKKILSNLTEGTDG